MKNLITYFLILFGMYSVQSQDLIKELKKLTLENDSLKSQIIKPLNQKLKDSNEKNRIEIFDLKVNCSRERHYYLQEIN